LDILLTFVTLKQCFTGARTGSRKRTRKRKIDEWEEWKRKINVRRWGQNNIERRERDMQKMQERAGSWTRRQDWWP